MSEPTPLPTANLLPNWVHTVINLVKAHERLIIVGIAALVLLHFGDKGYDALKAYHASQAKLSQQELVLKAKASQDVQQQLAQMQAENAANTARLEAEIANSKQKVIIQQKKDAALPPTELSAKWADQVNTPRANITPQPNGTIAVTVDAAHATVNELDKIPGLNDQLTATQEELKGCVKVSAEKDVAFTAKDAELTADKKARVEDAKVAKDEARHQYWRGFKHGFIVGVAATVAATVAILH
jgi:hypothetical protein